MYLSSLVTKHSRLYWTLVPCGFLGMSQPGICPATLYTLFTGSGCISSWAGYGVGRGSCEASEGGKTDVRERDRDTEGQRHRTGDRNAPLKRGVRTQTPPLTPTSPCHHEPPHCLDSALWCVICILCFMCTDDNKFPSLNIQVPRRIFLLPIQGPRPQYLFEDWNLSSCLVIF